MNTERALSGAGSTLTRRQQVEASFYDTRAQDADDYTDADLHVDRQVPPFPNYAHLDFLSHALGAQEPVVGMRVLEVGCGSGAISVYLALRGAASVLGVDVSAATLRIAERRATLSDVADRTQFRAVPVEALDEPSGSFDRIVGNQVLHHFELATAMPRIRQLLKPGGRASFCEPVLLLPEVVRSIRDSQLVTRLFPRRVDTPTERSLSRSDIDLICRELPGARVYPYQLLARLQNFVPVSEAWFWRLQTLDRLVLRYIPPARALCRFVVIDFTQPSGAQHVS